MSWPERSIRVKDLMVRPATTIRWDATVGAAWKLMKAGKIRHLPVLSEDGRLVGIGTDRDLREVILDPSIQEQLGNLARALNILRVKQVMTWGVVTVRPGTDIREAARIMRDQRIGALPVEEAGRGVGILTGTDVLRAFVEVLEEGMLSRPERWRRVEA
jgi:acetoin utilization protein AcuB